MKLEQINNFILKMFDGPYDPDIKDELTQPEYDAIIIFLKRDGYIKFNEGDFHVEFTEKGYGILFKLHDCSNIDKLTTFGELKKLSEKFYGQRQEVGNIG